MKKTPIVKTFVNLYDNLGNRLNVILVLNLLVVMHNMKNV